MTSVEHLESRRNEIVALLACSINAQHWFMVNCVRSNILPQTSLVDFASVDDNNLESLAGRVLDHAIAILRDGVNPDHKRRCFIYLAEAVTIGSSIRYRYFGEE